MAQERNSDSRGAMIATAGKNGPLNSRNLKEETSIMPQQMIWFFVSIAFSLIAWGIVTARYIWPELRLRPRVEAGVRDRAT